MRILIIEDQPEILQNIADFLELKGYFVDCAYDGLGGMHLAVTQSFDLIILDLMLPGMDGITLCQKLRQDARVDTPIIMLTARDSVDDKLSGFQAGADDYLVKPFSLPELHARVEAILRRGQTSQRNLLTIGDLSYDMNSLEVTRQETSLKLSPIGLKILETLMKKSPHVVKREALEELLWGEDLPGSDSLRSHVHTLRQTIDKPFNSPLLHTVHGIGYCLKAQPDGI
jgi:DNA-binding response OmpR family regulator